MSDASAPITTHDVEIAVPDGTMRAFLCTPKAPGPHPAVLVLMEAFGLTNYIRDVTRRIAAEGYVALAPDLYYRDWPNNTFGYDQVSEGMAMMLRLDDRATLAAIRAALDTLASRDDVVAQRIAVTGFCLGGGLTFFAATELSDRVAAAAPFYGMVRDEWIEAVKNVHVPVLFFFGGADPFIPIERVRQIEARFRELGKDFRAVVYDGADHGFFCHERSSYHPEAAADAWRRLTAFLARQLRGGS